MPLEGLRTPAEICGLLAVSERRGKSDATASLRRLGELQFKHELLHWLPRAPRSRVRSYTLACELWGKTQLRRDDLTESLRRLLGRTFPRWRESRVGGLRIACKADPDAAIVGVQLESNLERRPSRPGSLRRHLATSLLHVAGAREGEAIVDPFVGSGTILQEASVSLRDVALIGADVETEALAEAQSTLESRATLLRCSFDDMEVTDLPDRFVLVSNLPFGVQFKAAPTQRLIAFLRNVLPHLEGLALLMGREQARIVARELGLRARNVLVLGRPATILYANQRDPP